MTISKGYNIGFAKFRIHGFNGSLVKVSSSVRHRWIKLCAKIYQYLNPQNVVAYCKMAVALFILKLRTKNTIKIKRLLKAMYSLFFYIAISGCVKPCNESLRIGEIVEIPIVFNRFNISEIDNILVYRIDNSNTNLIDTFLLRKILWANMARSANEIITDTVPSKVNSKLVIYESYFDNCTLIFDWTSGKDTLSNFEVRKSKEQIKDCHENDPNVKIDKLSFIFKGKTISKNETIQIDK